MPYWFETHKVKIPDDLRRNRKLTDEQRNKIIELYQKGFSIRKLAKIFNVDRNTVKWYVYGEEFRRKHYENKKAKNWCYDKDKHTEAMQRYRRRKKDLFGLKREKKEK